MNLPPVVRDRLHSRYSAVLMLLVCVGTYFALTEEQFLTADNLRTLLMSVSMLWVVAIGVTFVMLVGNLDLSIGGSFALTGIVLAWLYTSMDMQIVVAIVITLAIGAALGALANGLLVGRFQVSFLVVTLGTQWLYSGLVNLASGSKTTAVAHPYLDDLAFGRVLGVPVPVIVMAVVYLLARHILGRTLFGRDIYAVGGNPQAARLSGINVTRTLVIIYAISGASAAMGGIMQVSRIAAASPQVGQSILFDAVAAVLLGGTSFRGGSGGVTGTAVGVLFLGVLSNGLAIAGIASYWQQIITGAIVVLAGIIDKVQRDGSLRLPRRSEPLIESAP